MHAIQFMYNYLTGPDAHICERYWANRFVRYYRPTSIFLTTMLQECRRIQPVKDICAKHFENLACVFVCEIHCTAGLGSQGPHCCARTMQLRSQPAVAILSQHLANKRPRLHAPLWGRAFVCGPIDRRRERRSDGSRSGTYRHPGRR